MKKLLITSALILSGFISYAQDFTGKNMKTVERMIEQYNFRIVSKGTLEGIQSPDFKMNNYTWCHHWVIMNDNRMIELGFHPTSGIVFLQTTSLQQYIKKY
tara:strand:- start:408 stop:710 length:303 start_codon:yes stop_codon:yes gene_type:complete